MQRCILLPVLAVVCGLGLSVGAVAIEREQTHFSAEDEHVAKPEPLPRELKELLLQDLKKQGNTEAQEMTVDTLPTGWFSASVIHLGPLNRKDWIVEGETDQRGANITPFWVFIETELGYRLVLYTDVHDFEVENSTTHGYRDLTTTSMACCQTFYGHFRFDGRQYKRRRLKSYHGPR